MIERQRVDAESNDEHATRPGSGETAGRHHGVDILVEQDVDVTDGMLSLGDAARRAGVTRSAILRWIGNGYLPAQTSSDGWMIYSEHIDAARDANERARTGFVKDDAAYDSGSTSGGETAMSLVPRTFPSPGTLEPLTDTVVSPLADLIRDQIDMVQDQAETIGWLQSELREMRKRLAEIEGTPADSEAPSAESSESEEAGESTLTPPVQVDNADARGDIFAMFHEAPANINDRDLASFDAGLSSVDIFSDEAAHARMIIEESERKINELWREQGRQSVPRAQHPAAESVYGEDVGNERAWLERLLSPVKRRPAE